MCVDLCSSIYVGGAYVCAKHVRVYPYMIIYICVYVYAFAYMLFLLIDLSPHRQASFRSPNLKEDPEAQQHLPGGMEGAILARCPSPVTQDGVLLGLTTADGF